MVGESVTVTVDAKPVLAMLARAEHAISTVNIGQALRGSVADYLQERARERFASEGDDASGKWAPLSWVTVKMRQEQGYGSGPINQRTGEMLDYLSDAEGELFSNEKRVLLRWPDQELPGGELGSKILHAQGGSVDPPAVARPVIAANETDLMGVLQRLGNQIYSDMGVVAL